MLTILSLAACGDDVGDGDGDGGHTHSFAYVGDVTATCTTESYKLSKCSCGEEKRDVYAAKLGHTEFAADWELEKEPTLTETGCLSNECARCGEKSERVLPKLNETDYDYSPATNLNCGSSLEQARDYYHVQVYGEHYNFKVQLEIPEHDYQPVYTEYEYSEYCDGCSSTKENTWHAHEYVLDNYKGVCPLCDHESEREVFKVTATNGTKIVGTLSHGMGSNRLYFDEPVSEVFVFEDTYVIAASPDGPYYDGVDSWHVTTDNGENHYSDWSEEYDISVWCDTSVYAEMDKKQARISVQWSNGLKDADGNFVSYVSSSNSYSYYNVNLGDTYTLVPGTNTETTVFLGWTNGADDYETLFTNNEIVITEGTTSEVLAKNSFVTMTSSLTALLPFSTLHDYILVSGYLYNTETLTVTKYDTPTALPLNSAGNMDIQFVSYYNEDANALYVKNVNDEGDTLARGLYYSDFGGNVYCLTDSNLDFRRINYTVSPENVTVNGEEYCEFKFIGSGGKHTNLDLYWGKSAAWMYQGHNLASAKFYLAASPEDYLDVSDITVFIRENSQNYSTITISLNSLPTEEELVAYYKAFITEYQSNNGMHIYTSRPCGNNDKITTEYQLNNYAQYLYSYPNQCLYMWLTNYYCCQLQFSLDTANSELIITLTEIYKN